MASTAREDAAGAEADDDRSQRLRRRRSDRRAPGHVRRGADVGMLVELRQQCRLLRLVNQRHVDDVDGHQIRLAGVEAALEDIDLRDLLARRAAAAGGARREGSGCSASAE